MKSPKEKADELIDKMYYIGRYDDKENYNPAMAWERAKECAIIAVNLLLDEYDDDLESRKTYRRCGFLLDVIEEIKKL